MDSKFIIFIIIFFIVDIAWINTVMVSKYRQKFDDLGMNMTTNYISAFIAYALLIGGIKYFVLDATKNKNDALIKGAFFGLVVYGVYDGTLYT